ncbi:MAG: hypothetical protein V3R33_00525 [Anaerolineales bacterium]
MATIPFSGPPVNEKDFEIGDHVEVFCDHDLEDDRVRDWLEGVVVKRGHKKVAVQFHKNVYLTDGWMVPDRVLWCAISSQNIRRPTEKRRSKS